MFMELQIFSNSEFGEIRTITKDNETYFVGKDVAKALGFANPRDAIATHVFDEDKGVDTIDTLGGKQSMTVINESGVYALVFGSRLESAKRFKHWVTSEVLPSIRKNGGYIAGQETMSDEELMAKALLVANNKIAERDKIIEQKQARIEPFNSFDYVDVTSFIG
jgi:anti-repressor protein